MFDAVVAATIAHFLTETGGDLGRAMESAKWQLARYREGVAMLSHLVGAARAGDTEILREAVRTRLDRADPTLNA